MKSDKILVFDSPSKGRLIEAGPIERIYYLIPSLEKTDYSPVVINELDELRKESIGLRNREEIQVQIISLYHIGNLYAQQARDMKHQFLTRTLPRIGKPLSRRDYLAPLRKSIDSFVTSSDIAMTTHVLKKYAQDARFMVVDLGHEFFDDIFQSVRDRGYFFSKDMLKKIGPLANLQGWGRAYGNHQDKIDGLIRLIDGHSEKFTAGTYK